MKTAFEILQSKLTIADTSEFREIHIPEILDAMEKYKAQFPQQEISDEEIKKAVNEYVEVYQCPSEISMCKHDVISAWNNGIKWYREQLKCKGNGES